MYTDPVVTYRFQSIQFRGIFSEALGMPVIFHWNSFEHLKISPMARVLFIDEQNMMSSSSLFLLGIKGLANLSIEDGVMVSQERNASSLR